MIPSKLIPLLSAVSFGWSQEPVNRHALMIQDFQARVAEYAKLRQKAVAGLPRLKPTESPATITRHEQELARRIHEMRPAAKAGDIFNPEIAAEFHRLIAIAMQGHEATRVHQSLNHAEPVWLRVRVNDPYPTGVPLQSTPPTLILNLPMLPKELDYRVVGRVLVLRDAEANMIVDFILDAIP